jgi:hypothetical protein
MNADYQDFKYKELTNFVAGAEITLKAFDNLRE